MRSCTSHPIYNFVFYEGLSPSFHAFVSNLNQVQVPRSIHKAVNIPEWKTTILEEIQTLEKNKTWDVTELPPGKRPVGCKWIFTIKHKADGSIEMFKACLVAKGFTQSYGIDYQETLAHVAKLNTVRALLSLASNLDWPL